MADEVTYRRIGERLREARLAAKRSLDDVARELDTTYATISRYELGESRISIPDLCKAANYLGVPIGRLITGEEMSGLTENEDQLLSYFRGMTEEERESFLRWLGASNEARQKAKRIGRRRTRESAEATG